MQQFDLLVRLKVGENLAIVRLARLVNRSESVTIGLLESLVRPAKLAIDVTDDARPDRAGILVRRDDLVDHAGEGSGLVKSKEAPGRSIATAGDARSCSSSGRESGLQKGAAIQSEGRLHPGYSLGLYRVRIEASVISITTERDLPGQKCHFPRSRPEGMIPFRDDKGSAKGTWTTLRYLCGQNG